MIFPPDNINQVVDHLFRHESGKMVSVLSRLLGLENLETAQDIVQDVLLQAMVTWSYKGIPQNPSAWMYRAAKNKAIDILRREKKFKQISPQYSNEETISKRIYRAKEKIKADKIELGVPRGKELPGRLDTVLKCLYLLFNEGYNSSHPEQLIREDLCHEAIRLTYLLTMNNMTNVSRTNALLSLMCFQASRLQARLDDEGNIILLKHQNRGKWYKPLMEKGFEYLELATEVFQPSSYHLEAAIASLHASARSFEQTDWKSIYHLYEILYKLQPVPIVALNKAIASAYAIGRENALEQLLQIKGLENYYLYHTSLGEIYYELHDKDKAKTFYENALRLTTSRQQQQLLISKINNCDTVQ